MGLLVFFIKEFLTRGYRVATQNTFEHSIVQMYTSVLSALAGKDVSYLRSPDFGSRDRRREWGRRVSAAVSGRHIGGERSRLCVGQNRSCPPQVGEAPGFP